MESCAGVERGSEMRKRGRGGGTKEEGEQTSLHTKIAAL